MPTKTKNPQRPALAGGGARIGVLLAGGRATRMGGGDKALRTLGGVPLLARAIAILRPQCDALLISANGPAERLAKFGLPVVADDVKGFAGPLAGILAALDFIAARHPLADFALSAATDVPFLPANLAERLDAARSAAGADIACARSGGATHPVVALWPVALRTALRQALVDENVHKVDRFMARFDVAYADWPIGPFDPFFNINGPEDLAAAEQILTTYGDPPVMAP